jgi:hypothetical protein
MAHRHVSPLIAVALSLGLSACGGGGSSSVTGGGGGGGNIAPGSLLITPASLTFSGPGAASQTFTISSTVPNLPAPQVNLSGCSPVAGIATASTTLPATYTVSPTANGNCTFIANLGNASATIGITVGPSGSPGINGSTNTVALFVGGTAGSVTVSSSSGNPFTADATACNGVASVTNTSNAGGSASYSVAPIAAGTCQFPIVNGSSSFLVAVVVNTQPSGPGALQLSTTSMTFASQNSPAQQATLSFTGNVGQVSINQSDCIGQTGKPKMVYFSLPGVKPGTPVSLPATIQINPYGPVDGGDGTCVIHFIPQNGTGVDLTVTI